MSKEQFLKAMIYLGTAYNKEYDKAFIQIWYEYFKNIDYTLFMKAVKRFVAKSKYPPSIAELLSECIEADKEIRVNIIDKMKADGYFKLSVAGEQNELEEESDYMKAIAFVTALEHIPSWLEEDMKKYGYQTTPLILQRERKLLAETN